MKNIIIKNLLTKILVLSAVFSVVLCSCGFKGPLYLPKKPAENTPQASKPANASSPKAATKVNSSSPSATPNGLI